MTVLADSEWFGAYWQTYPPVTT